MTKIKVAISKDNKIKIEEITLNKEWQDVNLADFKNLTISGGSICGFYKTEE